MDPMVMPIIAYDRTLAGGAETEGGRRPTVVSAPPAASPELPDRPRRRTFKAADKLRILRQVDEAEPGGIGAILRREGLYSSLLTDWRRQRDAGAYEALKAVRRGPKPAVLHPLAAEHAQLQRDYRSVTQRLQRAEAVIEIQKKVALLLGLSMPGDEAS
jgi:transposase